MNPRYFIGILLPDGLQHEFSKIQHELFVPGKVMAPLKPHITLLHPQMLETLHPLHFVPKIREVSQTSMPLTIKLTGTAMFDQRIFYASVECPQINALYEKLVSLLPPDVQAQYVVGRPFTAHLTLVQAKPRQNLDPVLIREFEKEVEPILPQTFTAKYLTEFRWIRPRVYKTTQI